MSTMYALVKKRKVTSHFVDNFLLKATSPLLLFICKYVNAARGGYL